MRKESHENQHIQ